MLEGAGAFTLVERSKIMQKLKHGTRFIKMNSRNVDWVEETSKSTDF